MYYVIRHDYQHGAQYIQCDEVSNKCTDWHDTLQPFTNVRRYFGDLSSELELGNVIAQFDTPFTPETHPEFFI